MLEILVIQILDPIKPVVLPKHIRNKENVMTQNIAVSIYVT
jgi:hypothetical protein